MSTRTQNSGDSDGPVTGRFDAIVVGAGFAGLYMLYRLRQDGLNVRGIEAAPDVGGTWYWNRYPGCRCDIESFQYSYQFDKDLQQEWTWKERYASQPEILAYIEHVADRFDLRRDFRFDTRVTAATFDETANEWEVVTDSAETLRARYFILGTGCLSSTVMPDIPGMKTFKGGLYHTGRWPTDGVDFTGRRIGVIGTGSSAVQSIPLFAGQADHVYVFQRTPNFVVEAQNRPLPPEEMDAIKADYDGLRENAKSVFSAYVFPRHDDTTFSVSPEEREARFEEHWNLGGLQFFGAFSDMLTSEEANAAIVKFWRAKIGEVVKDPAVADLLTPDEVFGCKRLCAGTNYYEVYNRDNVTLVDVSKTGIETFTETGLRAEGEDYALDDIVCATGFDAMTGSIMRIDVAGKGGRTIQDKWRNGPDNFIGLAIAGFPTCSTCRARAARPSSPPWSPAPNTMATGSPTASGGWARTARRASRRRKMPRPDGWRRSTRRRRGRYAQPAIPGMSAPTSPGRPASSCLTSAGSRAMSRNATMLRRAAMTGSCSIPDRRHGVELSHTNHPALADRAIAGRGDQRKRDHAGFRAVVHPVVDGGALDQHIPRTQVNDGAVEVHIDLARDDHTEIDAVGAVIARRYAGPVFDHAEHRAALDRRGDLARALVLTILGEVDRQIVRRPDHLGRHAVACAAPVRADVVDRNDGLPVGIVAGNDPADIDRHRLPPFCW